MCRFTDARLREILEDDTGDTDALVADLARELLALRNPELTAADRDARMRTLSGWLHPLAPRPGELRIRDIARGLACQIRYKGQTRRPYTVAEHSVIVSLYVHPDHAREALLHDASEAFLGDMSAPVKRTPSMVAFRRIEDTLQAAIFAEFGVVPTEHSSHNVHVVDQRLCSDEMPRLIVDSLPPDEHRAHMASVIKRCGQPLGATVAALPIAQAEYLFMARFVELFPERVEHRMHCTTIEQYVDGQLWP